VENAQSCTQVIVDTVHNEVILLPKRKPSVLETHTIPYKLLELIAICGELPAGQIKRLYGSTSYKFKAITRLKEDNYIRLFYRDQLRGYRLNTQSKRLLLLDNSVRFSYFLSGASETNRPKVEITRRLRLHRIAETYITMLHAGVFIFRDEKPPVFYPAGKKEIAPLHICEPTFYSSREIKEVGTNFVKIKNARMVGALLTLSALYVVYNSSDAQMKWHYKSEMRTKALMKTILCRERLPHQYHPDQLQAVLLGDSMDVAYRILMHSDGQKRNYFVLDLNYEHFHFFPNDTNGESALKLLCDAKRTQMLHAILSENLFEARTGWAIEHDAIAAGDIPVLFACNFDMPRIARFATALQFQERQGIIICFDFQADVLRRYCGEYTTIQTISLEKFKGGFY